MLNDQSCWTKLLNIEPILEVLSLFGFGELVKYITTQLLLYNFETQELDKLEIKDKAYSVYLGRKSCCD